MVSVRAGRSVRLLLTALLVAVSALNAEELSSKEAEAFLSRLSASRAGSAMQADFREERRLALMNKPVIETGTLSFLPPDKFRRQVEGGSLTVCDGDSLWLYYPQFGEAERYTLSANRPLRESVAAMTSGFGLQDLSRNYNVRITENRRGLQYETGSPRLPVCERPSRKSESISPTSCRKAAGNRRRRRRSHARRLLPRAQSHALPR